MTCQLVFTSKISGKFSRYEKVSVFRTLESTLVKPRIPDAQLNISSLTKFIKMQLKYMCQIQFLVFSVAFMRPFVFVILHGYTIIIFFQGLNGL